MEKSKVYFFYIWHNFKLIYIIYNILNKYIQIYTNMSINKNNSNRDGIIRLRSEIFETKYPNIFTNMQLRFNGLFEEYFCRNEKIGRFIATIFVFDEELNLSKLEEIENTLKELENISNETKTWISSILSSNNTWEENNKLLADDTHKWVENLITLDNFKELYPSIYALLVPNWDVLIYNKPTDKESLIYEEYLIWININGSISLYNDINNELLSILEKNAWEQLSSIQSLVDKIMNNISYD